MSSIENTQLLIPPPIKLRYQCTKTNKKNKLSIQTVPTSNSYKVRNHFKYQTPNKHLSNSKNRINSFKNTKNKQVFYLSPIPPSKRFTFYAKIITKTQKNNQNTNICKVPVVLLSARINNKHKNENHKNNDSLLFNSTNHKRNYIGGKKGISRTYLANSTSLNLFSTTYSNTMTSTKRINNSNIYDLLKMLKIHKQLFTYINRFVKDSHLETIPKYEISDYLRLIKRYFILIQNIHFSNSDVEVVTFSSKDPKVYNLYLKITKMQLLLYSIIFICLYYLSLDDFSDMLKDENGFDSILNEFNKIFICFYCNYFLPIIPNKQFNNTLCSKNNMEYESTIKFFAQQLPYKKTQSKNKQDYKLQILSTSINKCNSNLKIYIQKAIQDDFELGICFKPFEYIFENEKCIASISSLISNHILFHELNTVFKHSLLQLPIKGTIHLELSDSYPFLPEINASKYKYSLVVDLDETLIHSFTLNNNNDQTFYVRPFCFEFLNELSTFYEIIIFTAGTKEYAEPIINQLDKSNKIISHKLYREHLSYDDGNGNGLKDLSKIGRDLDKIIIIDNIADNYILQKDNGLLIKTWNGNLNDRELFDLKNVLRSISTFIEDSEEDVDVRKIINEINNKVDRNNKKERPYKDINCVCI